MPRSQAAEKEPQIELESEKVIAFIRDYCVVPDGPNRGQPALLSLWQGLLPSPRQ